MKVTKIIQLKDMRHAKVEMKSTTYSGFNFEVSYKDGTSSGSRFFHDATQAKEFFDAKVKEYEGDL